MNEHALVLLPLNSLGILTDAAVVVVPWDPVDESFVTRSTRVWGVGDILLLRGRSTLVVVGLRGRGVVSSSFAGSGGTSSECCTAAGLGGLEREHERDEALRPSGMPNRSCSTWRAPDALGVVGREADAAAAGRGLGSRCGFAVGGRGVLSALADGVFLGLGVADGVMVVLVVDDSGREGMREAGFDAGFAFRGVGVRWGMVLEDGRGAGCSFFDRERDRERVRKL